MATESEKTKALRTMGAAIFGRNNLIDSDFEDVGAWRIQRTYPQDGNGILIQFSISWHAIGKVQSTEVSDALDILELSDEEYR